MKYNIACMHVCMHLYISFQPFTLKKDNTKHTKINVDSMLQQLKLDLSSV